MGTNIVQKADFLPQGRSKEDFRTFDEQQIETNYMQKRVFETYTSMHTKQTVEFVKKMHEKWCKFNHSELTVMEALELLNKVVDESDPDVDVPNIVHAFQTAERIREFHPDKEWMQLVGLIHDMGKVLAAWGEPHWAVCGDTFVVGCKPTDSIAFRKTTFGNNPDLKDSRYNTPNGMYKEHCGLENVYMSWGHDEYMYQVLKNHPTCTIPEEGLYMVRFHSFYPWHGYQEYTNLSNEKDQGMLPWVLEFNKFDLYSKSDSFPDVKALTPYYQGLIDKYLPGKIRF